MNQSVINPFPNKPWVLRVCSTSLLQTLWKKEKLLVTSNFSFFLSVFYPFGELSAIFIKFKNCRLQTLSIWTSLKFVFWERVKRACLEFDFLQQSAEVGEVLKDQEKNDRLIACVCAGEYLIL